MLLGAVAVECVLLLGFLPVPAISEVLDHAFHPPAGLALAMLAAPVLLASTPPTRYCDEGDRNPGRRSLATSSC